MRQKFKDLDYYSRFISELCFIEQRSIERHKLGQIPQGRINVSLDLFRTQSLKKTILKYTFGLPLEQVKKEFKNVIEYTNESWIGLWTLKLSADNFLKQYILSGYDEMLWMLSLGYLLEIPEEDFKKFVNLIDKDGVKDYLFEFIIKAKLKDRPLITEESYEQVFLVPKKFDKLRTAICILEKKNAEKLVRDYIVQDWYKNRKGSGWYDNHKSIHDIYFGYWSFETAAIVKIMNLDDNNIVDCQYYPKDLLDFQGTK